MKATRNPNGPSWAVAPRDWGAQVDYDAWKDPVFEKDAIAIHHGGGGNYPAALQPHSQDKEEALLRKWERYHLAKKWRGIGYGYGVGMTGTVYRLRGWNNYGAHQGDLDGDKVANNKEIVPVILLMSGMLHRHIPSEEMLAGFGRLRAYLEETEGRGLALYGHKEVQLRKRTACPGPNNMVWIRQNRTSRGTEPDLPGPATTSPFPAETISTSPAPKPTPETTQSSPPSTVAPDTSALAVITDWIRQEQANLIRAGFKDQKGKTLKVDGVAGAKTQYARLQRDLAAAKNGVPYGKPITIQEVKNS